jgi:hypothetical protein
VGRVVDVLIEEFRRFLDTASPKTSTRTAATR